jgi:hypothetical protein
MGFSWEYRAPNPKDPPHVELQRLASEPWRAVDLDSEFLSFPAKRLILGTEDIPLDSSPRLRGLAKLLKVAPAYIVELVLAHLRATDQPIPTDIVTPEPVRVRKKPKASIVNKSWAFPPRREPTHYRPRRAKVSDAQVHEVARLKVENACRLLSIGPTALRGHLRRLGYSKKPQGRPARGDKSNAV